MADNGDASVELQQPLTSEQQQQNLPDGVLSEQHGQQPQIRQPLRTVVTLCKQKATTPVGICCILLTLANLCITLSLVLTLGLR